MKRMDEDRMCASVEGGKEKKKAALEVRRW